jgi:hypothetical protein
MSEDTRLRDLEIQRLRERIEALEQGRVYGGDPYLPGVMEAMEQEKAQRMRELTEKILEDMRKRETREALEAFRKSRGGE